MRHFAYPYGRSSPAAAQFVRRFYETAAVQGFAKIPYARLDPGDLPRIPVSVSDGFWFFRLRLSGLPVSSPREGQRRSAGVEWGGR